MYLKEREGYSFVMWLLWSSNIRREVELWLATLEFNAAISSFIGKKKRKGSRALDFFSGNRDLPYTYRDGGLLGWDVASGTGNAGWSSWK